MTKPLAHVRPGDSVAVELMAALIVDIFAAIEGQREEPEPGLGCWSHLILGHNQGIDAALAAAGDVVKRHGVPLDSPVPGRG